MKYFIQFYFLAIQIIFSASQSQNTSNFNQIYDKTGFQIGYKIIDQFLYFNISCVNKGWIALGYGDGMTNVDMTILSLKNNSLTVEDYWGFQPGQIIADVALKGTNNVQFVGNLNTYNPRSGQWQIIFKRPLAQSDNQYDSEIIIGKESILSIALGDTLQFLTSKQHIFADRINLTYETSTKSSNQTQTQQNINQNSTQLNSNQTQIQSNSTTQPNSNQSSTQANYNQISTQQSSNQSSTQPNYNQSSTQPNSNQIATQPNSNQSSTQPNSNQISTQQNFDQISTQQNDKQTSTQQDSNQTSTQQNFSETLTQQNSNETSTQPQNENHAILQASKLLNQASPNITQSQDKQIASSALLCFSVFLIILLTLLDL